MKEMSVAQAIVEIMIREGVEKAFCVPGESYLSVLDALYENRERIQLISCRHEGGASFMAEGYAKISGKVGVCLATRGPGATNLSIGLHTAHQDSTPMVAFVGQVERKNRNREAFQEIDLVACFKHIVKWSVELTDADRAPEFVHRAFHTARTGRPGPVLVSLPVDVLDEVTKMYFPESKALFRPRPERGAVVGVKRLLESSDRPIIIAGGGIAKSQATPELVRLAERMHVPVISAHRRFDVFPNDHSHYVGFLGSNSPQFVSNLIRRSDLILAIGTRLSQQTTQNYSLINATSRLVHIDIASDELNKVYRPCLGITADAKQFILDLLEEPIVEGKEARKRLALIGEARKKFVEFSTPSKKNDSDYVDLEGMFYDINTILPDDTILTNDAGNFAGWLAKYYLFKKTDTYVGPTSGAMGYGLPAGIGAKLAYPDRPVVTFSGDGGFMMTIQELETAVRYDVSIISIVINNNMYGTIRMHQEKHFPNRVIATTLSNPSFSNIMKAMGGYGEFVEKNDDFAPALLRALELNKPSVIEVKANPQKISVSKTIYELQSQ